MPRDFIRENIRLCILNAMHKDMGGYTANDSMIDDSLTVFGIRLSRDEIKTHLSWLAEQDLLTLEEQGDYYVVSLTGRGEDVATGRAVVPGVKRPRAR